MVKVKVEYVACGEDVQRLRTILCNAQRSEDHDANPLTQTIFNEMLERVAQEAFDEGRKYERDNTVVGRSR
jgi:hypothetical protein